MRGRKEGRKGGRERRGGKGEEGGERREGERRETYKSFTCMSVGVNVGLLLMPD
jgi:hypothetical protein